MYKLNHEHTRSAIEKIGLALFIAGALHISLSETFLPASIVLTAVGFLSLITSLLEKIND